MILSWLRIGAYWFFIVAAILGGLFFFWKKAREEHFDLWEAIDALILSAVAGVIGARLGYVLLHPGDFGLSLIRFLSFSEYPGLWWFSGLLVAFLVMYRFAQQSRLDVFEVWDFYSILLAWYFGCYWFALLFTGAGAGTSTRLPWGLIFPGRVEPAHPVQLYASVVYFVLFGYLLWVEPRYRFFFWYRSKNRSARTGYLSSAYLLTTGLLAFCLSFVQPSFFLIAGFDINQILGALIFLVGCGLLYLRSGRSFLSWGK